jgi:hypothetical protein
VLTLTLSGGALLDGELDGGGVRYDVSPGWLAAVTVARQWVGGGKNDFFLTTSLTVGFSSTHTESPAGVRTGLTAQDTRLGVIFGRTFAGIWNPYVVGRVFGGPVHWSIDGTDVVGGDRHHYTIGLGGSLALGSSVDLVAEGMFFGERSFVLGMTYSSWD